MKYTFHIFQFKKEKTPQIYYTDTTLHRGRWGVSFLIKVSTHALANAPQGHLNQVIKHGIKCQTQLIKDISH